MYQTQESTCEPSLASGELTAQVSKADLQKLVVDFSLANGFETDDDLHGFISVVLGYDIPKVKVCDNHCAPFDFIADNFFGRVRNSLAFANRQGGKTRIFSVLNFLDAFFNNGCEIAQIGAIMSQAFKCYKYTQEYFQNPLLGRHVRQPLVSRTLLDNKSIIEVLSGTVSGVNSPHPQKANGDEIELMKWDILQEFFSMSVSKGNILGQQRLTSTRKYPYGTMQKLMDKISLGEINFKIYEWCIWEAIEKCPDERKCLECVLYSNLSIEGDEVGCQGKAKRAAGFQKIDDVIDKFQTLDKETWEAQWLNLRPNVSGLVYKIFSVKYHVRPGLRYNVGLPLYMAFDFGITNPTVCLYCQIDGEEIYIIDEYVGTGGCLDDHIKSAFDKLKKDFDKERPDEVFGDLHGIGGKEAETNIHRNYSMRLKNDCEKVADGISIVRQILKVTDGKSRLMVSPKCKTLIWEMSAGYHYPESNTATENPVKENDHCCDALRYFVYTYLRRNSRKDDYKYIVEGKLRESANTDF